MVFSLVVRDRISTTVQLPGCGSRLMKKSRSHTRTGVQNLVNQTVVVIAKNAFNFGRSVIGFGTTQIAMISAATFVNTQSNNQHLWHR